MVKLKGDKMAIIKETLKSFPEKQVKTYFNNIGNQLKLLLFRNIITI